MNQQIKISKKNKKNKKVIFNSYNKIPEII